jgi:hypothetical protein
MEIVTCYSRRFAHLYDRYLGRRLLCLLPNVVIGGSFHFYEQDKE